MKFLETDLYQQIKMVYLIDLERNFESQNAGNQYVWKVSMYVSGGFFLGFETTLKLLSL